MEIGTIIPKTDTLKKMALSLPSLALDIYPYQGNLYILTPDSIYKIADAIEGKNTAAVWLDKDNQLPSDPMLLAIDSNIFVMSKTGILTTFYRGKKTAEVNTSIPISQDSILLTTEDSSFLYLVDKKMGRIHMVAKETGAIFKTLKLNNQEPITDATIDENESIFILTADNKIWKIAP